MWGREIVDLARAADALGRRYRVQVILTPQAVDIAQVAAEVEGVLVFAQHMDSLPPGRGIGTTLPEAVRAAGARGVLLNHVERRLSRDELARTIERAHEVGLATLVCADDERDAVEVAGLGPTGIIVEEPTLIGGGTRDDAGGTAITAVNEAIWRVNPSIRVLHGAGIKGPSDVYDVITAGAQGTGATSAIFTAANPVATLELMLEAVREAWDRTHPEETR
jgi:triosephosphate isomerase